MTEDELRELNAAREPVAEEDYADWQRREKLSAWVRFWRWVRELGWWWRRR